MCLDGTHVAINAPAGREELFVNRHGTHSINVQVGDKYVINIWQSVAQGSTFYATDYLSFDIVLITSDFETYN